MFFLLFQYPLWLFLEGVDGQVAGLIETKIDCIQHEFENLFIQGNNFAGVYDSFDMLSQNCFLLIGFLYNWRCLVGLLDKSKISTILCNF